MGVDAPRRRISGRVVGLSIKARAAHGPEGAYQLFCIAPSSALAGALLGSQVDSEA